LETTAYRTGISSVTVFGLTQVRAGSTAPSLKGTLPCPKPTPMENTRKNSKNSKTLKTLDLGVSLQGTTFPKKHTKKFCGFGPVRIPAGMTSRSFRKSDSSFNLTELVSHHERDRYGNKNGAAPRLARRTRRPQALSSSTGLCAGAPAGRSADGVCTTQLLGTRAGWLRCDAAQAGPCQASTRSSSCALAAGVHVVLRAGVPALPQAISEDGE